METMIDRVKGIMLEPRATWKELDAEFTKPGQVWGRYVIPLALITPIATMVGMLIFGKRVPFTSLTNPAAISTVISTGVASFVMALLSVFVLSRLISLLAPGFGGQRNDVQGLKAAAYSSTAAWLGGVFQILPALNLVSLISSLYSLVLLYVGLPILMKLPKDRAMGYTAVVIIAWIVIFLVSGAVVAAF